MITTVQKLLLLFGSDDDPPPARAEAERTDVLLQTILDFGDRATDGQIVQAIALPWLEIAREIAKDPSFLFYFSQHHRKFEEFLAGAYSRAGYDEVILTPQSGDGGRDVIAIKKGVGSVRILDQAKAYSPGRLVTADDLRAVLGVLKLDPNASKAVVTTTSSFAPTIFTSGQFTPHIPYQLELKDGEALKAWLKELADKGEG